MERPKVDMVKAGKRLRKLRGVRTRTGVSREIGISYSSLEAYENGTRTPKPEVREKLAAYYGVPTSTIFCAAKNYLDG